MIIEKNDAWIRGLKGDHPDEGEYADSTALAIAYFQMKADRYRRAMLIKSIRPTSIVVKHANMINSYAGLALVCGKWLKKAQGVSAAEWLESYRESISAELRAIEAGYRD